MADSIMHGCHNRPPFKPMVEWKGAPFPYRMSPDCQYSKLHDDPRCAGCNHKQEYNPPATPQYKLKVLLECLPTAPYKDEMVKVLAELGVKYE